MKSKNGKYKCLIPLGLAYKGQPKGLIREFIDFIYNKDAEGIMDKTGAVPVN